MKPYSVAGHDPFVIAGRMAILAVCFATVLAYYRVPIPLMDYPADFVSITSAVQIAGSATAITTVLFFILDHRAWRWPLVLKYLGVPNLNGFWIGTLNRTSFPDQKTELGLPILLSVKQTYRRIRIVLENHDEKSNSGITRSEAHSINIVGHAADGCTIHHMFDFEQGFGVSSLRLINEFKHPELRGGYVSSFPRKGDITLRKLDEVDSIHRAQIKIMTDQLGQEYLGINIETDSIAAYLRELKDKISPEEFEESLALREKRDGSSHHLTICSPPELSKSKRKQLSGLVGQTVVFAMTGLGSVRHQSSACYYITVISPHAALLRQRAGFGVRDFHITLGFNPQDIHDRPKDESTWI